MLPAFSILMGAVLWGLLGPISKFAFQAGLGPLEVAFWRGAIGGLLFALHGLLSGSFRVERRYWLSMIGFGIFGVALLEGSNLLAVRDGGAAFASILLYSATCWVALFSHFIFGEKISRKKWIAIFITLSGVTGVALGGGEHSLHFSVMAVTWGILSGLSYALFYIYGKFFFRTHSPQTLYMYAFPIGSLALSPFVDRHVLLSQSGTAWGTLLFLGVASTYLAYLFYSWGLKRMEPTRASILASFEPVVATFSSWVIWGEKLAPFGYFSAILVFIGISLMIL